MAGFARGFKAQANRKAVEVRRKLGLPPDAPLDPLRVCEYLDITVVPVSSLLGSAGERIGGYFLGPGLKKWSAATLDVGIRRIIVHNDGHNPVRQRSNLMHEIAHALLGHPVVPLLTTDGDRHFDGGVEGEANFLAGTLLITNEAACKIIWKQIPNADSVYGVSTSMLNYRLRVSGALIRAQRLRGA